MTVLDRPHIPEAPPSYQGGVDTKQYTIKGIEAETLEKVRIAARKEGMKVGAWISHRLREAASNALNENTTQDDNFQLLKFEIEKIDSCQRQDRELLISIQKGLADIVHAQHSMMSSLLSK